MLIIFPRLKCIWYIKFGSLLCDSWHLLASLTLIFFCHTKINCDHCGKVPLACLSPLLWKISVVHFKILKLIKMSHLFSKTTTKKTKEIIYDSSNKHYSIYRINVHLFVCINRRKDINFAIIFFWVLCVIYKRNAGISKR